MYESFLGRERDKQMNEKILKYRQKHKKCKYCTHCGLVVKKSHRGGWYFVCEAKEKYICGEDESKLNRIKLFCQCYEVRDED